MRRGVAGLVAAVVVLTGCSRSHHKRSTGAAPATTEAGPVTLTRLGIEYLAAVQGYDEPLRAFLAQEATLPATAAAPGAVARLATATTRQLAPARQRVIVLPWPPALATVEPAWGRASLAIEDDLGHPPAGLADLAAWRQRLDGDVAALRAADLAVRRALGLPPPAPSATPTTRRP